MPPRNALIPLALVGALVAAAPAAAARGHGPVAHAAGGDVPPAIPSLVQTRLTRTENALGRLTEAVDDNNAAKVTSTGKLIRRQMAAAWRGAVYYIKNPPPPVAGDARVRARRKPVAHASGGAVAGAVADQYTTAFAVFSLQHDVAATITELTDGARPPVLDAMSKTLFFTLDRRDKAIQTAHALDVPLPPDAPEGAASFATVMPALPPLMDDEIQQIAGIVSDATDLRPGGKRMLNQALVQTILAQNKVNTYWPPVVGG